MIRVENIVKKYQGKNVVENVSFSLPSEKIIAFIGSNGAGKSTLISIISRLISANEGKVFVDDKELSDWNTQELSRHLSVLSQSNHMNIRLTVKELVAFGRFPHSRGRMREEDWEIVRQALSYTDMEGFSERFLDELSGGQRQMAYIAMAIAQDTQYILLDEPLNNLDMKRSVKIMKLLQRLVEEKGKTILIVIHDINFVSCYADYIVALKDGMIYKMGNTKEIIQSGVLSEIYDMEIDTKEIDGNNICIYYT